MKPQEAFALGQEFADLQKKAAERDRLHAAVEEAKTLAEAALEAWKPEHEYHQDRAARKGYGHDEAAAEIYGLAIETVTEILEALGQTAKEG